MVGMSETAKRLAEAVLEDHYVFGGDMRGVGAKPLAELIDATGILPRWRGVEDVDPDNDGVIVYLLESGEAATMFECDLAHSIERGYYARVTKFLRIPSPPVPTDGNTGDGKS